MVVAPQFHSTCTPAHLRELTRYRSTLVAERAQLVNRVHKLLEDTTSSDSRRHRCHGRVGSCHARCLTLAGKTIQEILASLAQKAKRKKHEQLSQALQGQL